MKNIYKASLLLMLFFFAASIIGVMAQPSRGGTPPSFKTSLADENQPFLVPPPDVQALLAEDVQKSNFAPRAVVILPVDLNPTNSGEWITLETGETIWRLAIESKGAKAILLTYSNFSLPKGSKLFIYNQAKTQILGAYTEENNPMYGPEFSTELVAGDHIVLEYVAPRVAANMGKIDAKTGELIPNRPPRPEMPTIQIEGVGYAYNDFVSVTNIYDQTRIPGDQGSSGSCQININCSQGAQWQNQKKGVVATLQRIGNSYYICSGSLVNNLREDLTPYILMAWHCSEDGGVRPTAAQYNQWQFYFHWERPGCDNNAAPVTYRTVTGCTWKAESPLPAGSDGLLLQLNQSLPMEWDVYYNGWDATLVTSWSSGSVGIHHPAGDVKKISTASGNTSQTTANISGYANGATNAAWNCNFNPTVTEGGSSGSPLFNNQGLIIGTLTGGSGTCSSLNNQSNIYGKMGYHLDKFNTDPVMKPFLDPDNTGSRVCPGRYTGSDPIANFTASTQTPFAMQPVQFYSQSFNATSYYWEFAGGNPATSTETNPIVTYPVPGGPHSVTLTINGGEATKSEPNYITVSEKLNDELITIGTGTSTAQHPIGYANNVGCVHTATLYTAAQLGAAASIKSIAWYCNNARTPSRTIRVWMQHTTATNVQGTPTWNRNAAPNATATLVAEYTGQSNVAGWNTWNFNITPFDYNGTQNVIIFVETYGTANGSNNNNAQANVRYTQTGTNTNITWTSAYNANPTGNGTNNNQVPNIQLLKGMPSQMPVANFTGPVKVIPTSNETFDATAFPPAGWTTNNVSGSNHWARETPGHESTGCAVRYYVSSGTQNSWLITQAIPIPTTGYKLEFYSLVQYVSYYTTGGSRVLISTTNTQTGSFSLLKEFAKAEFVEGEWMKFSFSLDDYAGQTIYVGFQYTGTDAHSWFIDDVVVGSMDPLGKFQMYKDEILQLTDLSTGPPVVWDWEFPGSYTPEVQTFGDVPPAQYEYAGTYDLGLTVTNLKGSDTKYMPEQVVVLDRAPVADFTFKSGGYDAIGEYIDEYHPFIIPGQSVTYTNNSKNLPDSYVWTFEGGNPPSSITKDATTTYNTVGDYSVSLIAKNSAGEATYAEEDLVYVGYGPEWISNGNFPGSSWGMWTAGTNQYVGGSGIYRQIAERYDGPVIAGQISDIYAYVGGRGSNNTSLTYTISVRLPAANGTPTGTSLWSKTFTLGDLGAAGNFPGIVVFTPPSPISIPAGQPFFIHVTGFAASYNAQTFLHFLTSMGDELPEGTVSSAWGNEGTGNTGWVNVSSDFMGDPGASYALWPEFSYVLLDVNPQLTLPATAGNVLVPVTANVTYTAATTTPWFTVTVGASGVTVNYEANNTGNAREGSFTVTGGGATKTVTVLQAAGTLALDVTPEEQTIPYYAGSATYEITSNVLWTATCPELWVNIPNPIGANDGDLVVNAGANMTLQARTALITITGGDITKVVTLVQEGSEVYLEISPAGTIEIPKMNGSRFIQVSTNTDWYAVADEPWIIFTEQSGYQDGYVYYNFNANPENTTRTAVITVKAGDLAETLTVIQEAGDGLFTVNPNTLQLSRTAGSETVVLTSPAAWTAIVPDDAWYTVAPLSGNAGTQNITINYTANNTAVNRSSEVTFENGSLYRYLKLEQKGGVVVSWNNPVNGTLVVLNGSTPVTNGATVDLGTEITVNATPNTGYYLNTLTLNGAPFENNSSFFLTAPATLNVTFLPYTYVLTLDASPLTVTPSQIPVTYGSAIGGNLPATPGNNPGFTFMGWFIGTTQITQTTVWNYTSDQTAVAKWNQNYTLFFNPGTGGTVNPTEKEVTYEVAIGELPTPTRPGYTFGGWFIGTTAITATTIWTYTSNQTATALWNNATYTLTFDPNGGTLLPNQTTMTVTYLQPIGGTLPTPAAPKSGWVFKGWFIGETQIYSNTTWNYTSPQTAVAHWGFQITATNLNPNLGTIVPTGTIEYAAGDNATYVCTPNPGSHIITVVVDGVTVFTGDNETTAPYTHSFNDIDDSHTITVSFARNCYALNPLNVVGQGATLTMTPAGCVQHGSAVVFTITVNCATIDQILIDGTPYGGGSTYTISPVEGPLPLIEVITTPLTYEITATPEYDPHGSISDPGTHTFACGENVTYYFTTELGYTVSALYIDGASVQVPVSKQYTFNNLHADHTIHIEFAETPYYIIQFGPNAAQNAGGTVFPTWFPNAEYYWAVDSGTVSFPFTIQPDPGFVIDKVFVDDVYMASAVLTGTYNFININADHTIYATFKPFMFTIVAEAGTGGTINPSGNVQVAQGSDQPFLAVPDVGYSLYEVYVDGEIDEDASKTGFYLFEEVVADHTISATFAINTYTISATAGAYGSITPEGDIEVNYGSNKTFTFTPITGYKVDKVFIDGEENFAAAQNGSYTFIYITDNHTIDVTFTQISFTITSASSAGGTIVPEGVTTVYYNEHSVIYVFNPLPGYHVKQVLVDGYNDTQAVILGEYRFMNVKANHDIYVIFARDSFTIVATATIGGAISPAGAVSVLTGDNKAFVFNAGEGYQLVRVLIDDTNNPDAVAAGTYIFMNVENDHTIAAEFEKKTLEIFLPEIDGAVAVPVAGYATTVDYGSKFEFTVDIMEGYTQSTPIVRANSIVINPAGDTYIINNIVVDQTITIDGLVLNQYQIMAQAFTGGNITPAGYFTVNHGDSKTFEITPLEDYFIKDVEVDGVSVGAVDSYTFYNIKSDATIKAYFYYYTQGIDEFENMIQVFSYQNVVTIMNEHLLPVKQVEIMDMYGRVVWQGDANKVETKITLDAATGIYAVRVVTEAGLMTTKVSITK